MPSAAVHKTGAGLVVATMNLSQPLTRISGVYLAKGLSNS
jgi:hypothetical protein